MYYKLTDFDTNEELGLIKVINSGSVPSHEEELKESWNDFHVLEEHDELDYCDVTDFVKWNNENYVTQIERIFITHLNLN